MERVSENYWGRDGRPPALTAKAVTRTELNPAGRLAFSEMHDYGENPNTDETRLLFQIWNERYGAQLRRAKDPGAWLLVDLLATEGEEAVRKFRFRSVCPWLFCGNIWLPDWLADDCFVVKGVEEPKDGSPNPYLRVHFVHDESRRKTAQFPGVESGYIDFDQRHTYRPISYHYQTRDKVSEGTERGSFEYAMSEDIPVLEKKSLEWPRNVSKFGIGSGKEVNTYKVEFDTNVPDEKFRLSYYGLPEPVGVTWKKPVPKYLWFLLGAGACVVVATLLRYAARRRQTAKPRPE
jgi:hypothetical protein